MYILIYDVCIYGYMIYVYIYMDISYMCIWILDFLENVCTPDSLIWYNALRIMWSSSQELSLEPAKLQIVSRYHMGYDTVQSGKSSHTASKSLPPLQACSTHRPAARCLNSGHYSSDVPCSQILQLKFLY